MSNAKQTVLVIDDSAGVRIAVTNGLRKLGWSVLQADSPIQAMGLYHLCDVVLTDWDMPYGGGARVVDACETTGKPVVVHTGDTEDVPRHLMVTSKPTPAKKLDDLLFLRMRGVQ